MKAMISLAVALAVAGTAAPVDTGAPKPAFLPAVIGGGDCPAMNRSGWQQVLPAPASGRLGVHASLAQDGCGYPLVAYLREDPNGDSDHADSAVWFLRARADGTWTPPVQVELVGEINSNLPARQINLAFDGTNGHLALVYQANTGTEMRIRLAQSSDGGQTWVKETLPKEDNTHAASQPVVAVAGGRIYAAFKEDGGVGARFLDRAAGAGAFSTARVPVLSGHLEGDFTASPMALKLNSSGRPGLAYMNVADFNTTGGYTTSVAFWRASSGVLSPVPVKVMDSGGFQNDGPTLSLVYDGANPRIAALLAVDASASSHALVSASADGGVSFAAPVRAPNDGGHVFSNFTSLAINASHTGVLVTHSGGGNDIGSSCGFPKVSSSAVFLSWGTCGLVDLSDPTSPYYDGHYLNAAFDRAGRLMIVMMADKDAGSAGGGLLFWRQPG